jgi:hypothetical protein
MFPRQRLYETYQWDRINYRQIGGAGFGAIVDAAKKIDDIPGLNAAQKLQIKNMPFENVAQLSRFNLPPLAEKRIFEIFAEQLGDPAVQKNFVDAFADVPEVALRLPSNILNKLPDDFLKKLDGKKLAEKEGMDDAVLLRIGAPPKKLDPVPQLPNDPKLPPAPTTSRPSSSTPLPPPFKPDEVAEANRAIEAAAKQKPEVTKIENTVADDTSKELTPKELATVQEANLDAIEELSIAINKFGKRAEEGANKAIKEYAEKFQKFIGKNKNISKVDLKATGKAQTLDEAKVQNASFISRNKKTIIATSVVVLVAGGLATYGGIALDNFIKKNDAPFKIVGMEFDTTDPDGSIWIMYEVTTTTKFELTAANWILLKEHDSVPMIPPIERIYKIAEVDNTARKLRILIQKNEKPTTLGKSGKFLYQTTYDQQLLETAEDAGKLLSAVPAAVAGGVFGGILEGLGLTKQTFLIGAGVFVGLIVILIIIYMVMSSKSK